MANPTVTPAALCNNCFQGTVIDNFRRKCLLVYLLAVELNANGGTNYLNTLTSGTSGGLIGDAVQGVQQYNQDLIPAERNVGLYELGIQFNNAIYSGGISAGVDINTLMQRIKCLINVNERTLDLCIVWLSGNLGPHKSYPQ